MHANKLKVSVVITDFDQYLDVDTIGKKIFPASIEVGSAKLIANLNAKSVRKAQATFREFAGEVSVIISGELDIAAKVINSAGIAVQAKIPKSVAPLADDSAAQEPIAPEIRQPAPPPLVTVKKKRTIEAPS